MKTLFSSRINKDLLKYTLNRSKAFLVIFTVLLVTLFPVPIAIRLATRGVEYADQTLLVFMTFFLPVAMILFAVVPFLFFNYLFSSKSVDTFHSLPIKRADLFITYAFSSFLFAFIPFTIAYFSGYGIAYLSQMIPFASAHFTMYVRLVILFASLTALSVFVIMNTGTFSDALIYTGILSLLPFLAFTALNFFSLKYIFGFASGVTEFLVLTSPHFATLEMLLGFDGAYDANIIASYWLLLTIIATSISICIYNRRQSERSGHPFTNSVFFPSIASIFTGILLITLVAIWSTFDYGYQRASVFSVRVLLIPLLVSLVVYFLLSIIKNRSTKNSKRTLKQFGLIVLGTLVLCFVFIQTGGLGYEKSLPRLDSVKSVTLDNAYAISPLVSNQEELVFKDPKNIEAIYQFHNKIINEYRDDDTMVRDYMVYDGSAEFVDLTITYKMHKGSRLSRTYVINTKLLEEIQTTLFSKEAISQTSVFDSNHELSNVNVFDATLTQEYKFTGDLSKLRNYYAIDTASYTGDDWIHKGESVKYILTYTYKDNERGMIIIDSRMKNAIAYLEENITSSKALEDYSYYLYQGRPDYVKQNFDPFHGYYIGINRFPRFDISMMPFTEISAEAAKEYEDNIVAYRYKDTVNDVLQISGMDADGNFIDVWLPIIKE